MSTSRLNEHFDSFSFYPINHAISRRVFQLAKRIPSHGKIGFEASGVAFDHTGNRLPNAPIGTFEKKDGVAHLAYHEYASFLAPGDTGETKTIDVELAQFLRSLPFFSSGKERYFRDTVLDYLEGIRAVRDAVLEQRDTGNQPVDPHRPGAPRFDDGHILSAVICRSDSRKSGLSDFHADGAPGCKTVLSNIPTRFRDYSRVLEAKASGNFSVAVQKSDEKDPRPYDAAVFDTSLSEHGPPSFRSRCREFMMSHYVPLIPGVPEPDRTRTLSR